MLAGFDCLEASSPQEADELMRAHPVRLLVVEPELTDDMPAWLAAWRRRPRTALLYCSQWHAMTAGSPPRLLKPAPESDWWMTVSGLMRREEALQ